jgi:AcrR family transcriptional regulator
LVFGQWIGANMKKQDEKTNKTKQALLDAFCILYSKKPIEKITVQDITRKAGFNRSTFYQYFSDINELLECVENNILNYIQRKFPKGITNEKETKNIQEIVKIFYEKKIYLDALFGQYGGYRFLERLKAIIPASGDNHALLGKDKIAPYLIEYHNSTALSLLQLWHRRKKDLSTEELIDLISRLHDNGLSAF